MTAQILDSIEIAEQTYIIDRQSNRVGLFDPREEGISLNESRFSSACWRGFYCEYAVSDDRLFMMKLNLYPSYADELRFKYGKSTSLFYGRSPEANHRSMWQYRDLFYPIDYTGGLVIYNDYLRSGLIISNANPPLFLFKSVREIMLDRGSIVEIVDRSTEVEQVRDLVIADRDATNNNSMDYSLYKVDIQLLKDYFHYEY
jgi:hypothetical protein